MAGEVENKVSYGLKNVHWAPMTETEGVITYATPKRLPGAVEMTNEPNGEVKPFHADDCEYYKATNNRGYDGTLKIATITQEFEVHCLGEEIDTETGIQYESIGGEAKRFALLFEFAGDVKATRHVLYNCTANRPAIASKTTEDGEEPNVLELSYEARPRVTDNLVKAKTTAAATTAVYSTWYTKVHEKAGVINA